MRRLIYVGCGHFLLVIGILGFFLPILPGAPFVLLACGCYAKGSDRFHRILMENRWVGPSLQKWREQGSSPPWMKAVIGAMLAVSVISVTAAIWLYS